MSTRLLARAAVYAALYAGLTLIPGLNALAYRDVQFRVSECLLVFVLFDEAALPGIVVGTAIANAFGPLAIVDVWYGSLLTLAAGLLMQRLGRRVIALAVPVVVNGLGVPVELALLLHLPYLPSVGLVAFGEATVMLVLGVPLLYAIRSGVFDAVLPVAAGAADGRGGRPDGPARRQKGTP